MRELEISVGPTGLMPFGIDLEILEFELLDIGLGCPPRQRADPRHQFCKSKRFHQIVVRTERQSLNPVIDGILGSHHHDKRVRRLASHLLEDSPAVRSRKHHVEEDKVVDLIFEKCRGIITISASLDYKTFIRQPSLEDLARLGIIFDDEDFHDQTLEREYCCRI